MTIKILPVFGEYAESTYRLNFALYIFSFEELIIKAFYHTVI
jgi:hypothetical protein